MINFNRFGSKGGDKKYGKKSFGKKSFSHDRHSGKPFMHKATCDECGSLCEVPFKPSIGKPVFCNNCFRKENSLNSFKRSDEKRYNDRDFDRDSRSGMHSAICDECGDECEVPFRPTGGKPVFCHNCFKKGGDMDGNKSFNRNKDSDAIKEMKEKLEILNIKLDRILKLFASQPREAAQEKKGGENTPEMVSESNSPAIKSKEPKAKKTAKKSKKE